MPWWSAKKEKTLQFAAKVWNVISNSNIPHAITPQKMLVIFQPYKIIITWDKLGIQYCYEEKEMVFCLKQLAFSITLLNSPNWFSEKIYCFASFFFSRTSQNYGVRKCLFFPQFHKPMSVIRCKFYTPNILSNSLLKVCCIDSSES